MTPLPDTTTTTTTTKTPHQYNDSDSDINDMSRDLDEIGLLNLNNLTSYFSTDRFFSQIPSFEMKNFPLEFTKYVTKYKNYYQDQYKKYNKSFGTSTSTTATTTEADEMKDILDDSNILDSIKTVLSTRIQMDKFLNDLKLGVNITTAIDRLQPLTDVINETIFLPTDDFSDIENDEIEPEIEKEEITEPVGIAEIVNKCQPLINEIVKPRVGIRNELKRDTRRKRKRKQYKNNIYSNNESMTSQTSDIDGLTIDEVSELTELNSLDDFVKQDLLRSKIKKIHNLSISQDSKNKLVTKLMMGNYYKYVDEKLSNNDKQLLRPLKNQKLVIEEDDFEEEEPVEETQSKLSLDLVDEVINENDDIEEIQSESESLEGSDDEGEDEVMLTEEDLQPIYNDSLDTILGCSHYQTNCKIECPTCFKWYTCRFCHDSQTTDHKLIRNEVKHILCMYCHTPQIPDSNFCVNCEQELANYFCGKCILYDNDQTKDIYHCDKCGICRLGLGLEKDYFHCDTCNTCLSIDLKGHHKCLSDVTHSNCCICNEDLFSLIHKVVFMKCGHSIHEQCYSKFTKFSSKCPICKKTITNVESQYRLLDVEIAQSPLPEPYDKWRCIISCNDCGGKSNTMYHVLGLKCKYCKSYNTNQLKLIKPEEEEDEEEVEILEGEERGKQSNNSRSKNSITQFDANVMKLVKTNLLNNFGIDEEISGYEDDIDVEDEEEEEDDDDDQMGNLINIKKLSENGSNNVSYITSMLQNFVNNATKLSSKEQGK